METVGIVQALSKSRYGRLSYDSSAFTPERVKQTLEDSSETGKLAKSFHHWSERRRRAATSTEIPLGRTLYSPTDPKRPETPPLIDQPTQNNEEFAGVSSSSSPGPSRPVYEDVSDYEDEDELEPVLELADALDPVIREKALYNMKARITVQFSYEERVRLVREMQESLTREYEEKVRLADAYRAEQKRLKDLEIEELKRAGEARLEQQRAVLRRSVEAKAAELKSKTEEIELHQRKERERIQAARDEAIRARNAQLKEEEERKQRALKEEEDRRRALVEAQRPAQQVAQPQAQVQVQAGANKTLMVRAAGLKEYDRVNVLLQDFAERVKVIDKDPGLKQLRFQLQKAAGGPVNIMANDEGTTNFQHPTSKLIALLRGENVKAGEKVSVSINLHPEALPFCLTRMAIGFVKQAEDVVSSNLAAAFPLAAAIVTIWLEFPDFGSLFLAKLFHTCPYLIPIYLERHAATSDDLANRIKMLEGRKVLSDGWEDDTKFHKRMGGCARLFGAIVQTKVGRGKQHPCGPDRGWSLLASISNLDPKPGVTATILAEFLRVAGHRMGRVYGRQFLKLLKLLRGPFRASMEAASVSTVVMEEVLDEAFKTKGMIPKAKGALSVVI